MSDERRACHAPEAMVLAELGSGDAVTVDQLMVRVPQLTFGELFLALDALSRRGEVLMRRCGFEYEVSAPKLSSTSSTAASDT
jgi:hypothetical protein